MRIIVNDIKLRGCAQTQKLLPDIYPATEDDWHSEYWYRYFQ